MSALEAARDRLLRAHTGFTARVEPGDPDWLRDLRREALARFAEQGLPHRGLEDWRYTSLAALAAVPFAPASAPPPVEREVLETHCLPVFACSLFVFVNGRFAPGLSAAEGGSGGVRVESLAQLRRRDPERMRGLLGSAVEAKTHAFAALATGFFDDGALVTIPEGVEQAQPIHLVFVSADESAPAFSAPRVLVDARPGSRGLVIQDHVSLGSGPRLVTPVAELRVGRNAGLDWVLLQREDDACFHVATSGARVERDGRLACHTLSLGGALVRNDLEVRLVDEGADAMLNGLFVGTGDAVLDNHTLVDHAMPHGTSRELYKGILGGRSRGVFRGRVIVRPDAQKTDARQSNPNLLLSEGAEVNTKPQLEIHADDVKCSHGSSIGRLDADALFYLRSRGIGEARARDLLTRGFAAEVLDALGVPALAEVVGELLLERLGAAERAP